MDPVQKSLAALMLVAAFILLIEVLRGAHKGLYQGPVLRVALLCFILGPFVVSPLSRLIIDAAVAPLMNRWEGGLRDVPVALAAVVLLVVTDFFFYWAHRAAHTSIRFHQLQWLWKLHRTHHAGKYMNVTLVTRVNLLWYFVVPVPWVHAVAIYLGQGQAAAWAATVLFGWNLFTHTHFRWDDSMRRSPRLRPWLNAFEHIIITPAIHHTHHGWGNADGKNFRNFAVMCSFWDWIFGTLHIPEGRPKHYGLPGPYPHWAEEVFYPFYQAKTRASTQTGESARATP